MIPERTSPFVRELAEKLCEDTNPQEITALQSSAEVCVTLDDGTVIDEAYQAIPLLTVNRLLGKEITLNGKFFIFLIWLKIS